MFLHLGNNFMIRKDRIIAIIDIETGASNHISRNFLNNTDKIQTISDEGKEKSFIISDDGIYLSPISSTTLYKRSINFNELEL
jgi:hypothetical protein